MVRKRSLLMTGDGGYRSGRQFGGRMSRSRVTAKRRRGLLIRGDRKC